MIGLTPTQRRCYQIIVQHIAEHGSGPTVLEIAAGLGLKGKVNIHRMLTCLEERGYIRRLPNRARAIQLVKSPSVTLNSEILTLTDRYASLHGISRDTAANELLRIALGAAA